MFTEIIQLVIVNGCMEQQMKINTDYLYLICQRSKMLLFAELINRLLISQQMYAFLVLLINLSLIQEQENVKLIAKIDHSSIKFQNMSVIITKLVKLGEFLIILHINVILIQEIVLFARNKDLYGMNQYQLALNVSHKNPTLIRLLEPAENVPKIKYGSLTHKYVWIKL